MSPEQQAYPPAAPGSWGAPPPGAPPAGAAPQWGAPPPGAPPGGAAPQWGAPPPGQWGGQPGYPAQPRNGLGIAALILGILGLLSSIVVVGALPGLIAVVLGFVGMGKAKRGEATNRGVALAGVITGALAVLVAIALVAAGAAFVSTHKHDLQTYSDCLKKATTQEEQQACADQFGRSITP
jgi:hypothetical protein